MQNSERWWDYQYNGLMWPARLGIDKQYKGFHRIRGYIVDQVKDQHPEVLIERGYMLEWGSHEIGDPPEYEESPVETIIVRPIVKWYGRQSK